MKLQALKLYITFAVIICIICRNESYYSLCNESYYYEKKNEEKTSVSKCNSYTPVDPENRTTNNTCCYLHYKIAYAEVITYSYYYKEKGINKTVIKNNDINKTNHKKRNLEYLYNHYYTCIGLSYEGYKNIKNVIKDLESEQTYYFVDELNCLSKYLQFFINIILFQTILILL